MDKNFELHNDYIIRPASKVTSVKKENWNFIDHRGKFILSPQEKHQGPWFGVSSKLVT